MLYGSRGVMPPFPAQRCQCQECKDERGSSGRSDTERRSSGKNTHSALNAFPRKANDGPVFDWEPLVSNADREFARYASEVVEQIAHVYEVAPTELGFVEEPKNTPRTWPYPIIGVPDVSSEKTMEQGCMVSVDHVPREIINQIAALDVSISESKALLRKAEEYFGCQRYDARFASIVHLWGQGLATSDEVIRHLIHVEQNMPEKDTKHTNDVLGLLKAGLLSPSEARRSLGLPEISATIKADAAEANSALKAFRGASPDMIFVSPKDAERIMKLYEPTSNTKENPMPISTNNVADLANQVRELAKDGTTNLDNVKRAIDQGKRERKERIEKALSGAADLEVLKGAQGKQFFVKHFYGNKEHTTRGTAYPGYNVTNEEDEEDLEAYTVLLQDCSDPIVYSKYKTMQCLRKAIEEYGVPYVITFYE